jgi:hypothetical protein
MGVVDGEPLQVEEDQLLLDRGRTLQRPLDEGAARLVGGVGREEETGEGAGAIDKRRNPLPLRERVCELLRRKLADPSSRSGGEPLRRLQRLVEIGADPWVVRPVVQIRQ